MKEVTSTQSGTLTRIRESLGGKVAIRTSSADIIEHVRRRLAGEHVNGNGVRIPACSGATMTVELGYLAEVFKRAHSAGMLSMPVDPITARGLRCAWSN